MDEKYLYPAVRQVECNPVKANLVSLPEQWKWSGVRAQGKNDDIVDVLPILEWVEDWSAYLCSKNEDDAQMLRLHERTGRPPGSDQFVDKLEILAGRRLRPAKPGPKPSSS
jgi:putative transposase